MNSFENIVGEMKDMLKHVLEASKSQPSHQQITQELWNSVELILATQRELAELQHNSHMELIRVMVEARYKDTQADIRGIKESIVKLTGTSPAPIFEKEDQDDSKRGEKDSLRKLDADPKAKPKGQQQQKPGSAKDTSSKSPETSDAGKKKGVDETLNKRTDEEILEKQKRKDTTESKAVVWKREQEKKIRRETKAQKIGTSDRRKSLRNNRPPLATFPKRTAASKKPTTVATKPKPSPQKPSPHKPPQKK
ncbi:hypothetical protein Hanom_Chr10g00916501 [Helianthus anomalus]